MMFDYIKDYIRTYVSNKEGFVIDSIDNFDEKKLSIVLTYLETKMVSIELLPDGTCDLMAIEAESEELIISITTKLKNKEELEKEIYNFLNKLSS